MFNAIRRAATAALLGATALCATGAANSASAYQFDHVFVIFEENHGFDQVLAQGPDVATGPGGAVDSFPDPATPYLTSLALNNGLATLYFGTTHPSLPNYLSLVGGTIMLKDQTNTLTRVNTDDSSCYASNLGKGEPCYKTDAPNIADQLEAAGLTWAEYEQSYDVKQPLIERLPVSGGTKLYAQKHNPFAYFKSVATDAKRMAAHIRPLEAGAAIDPSFKKHLNDADLENFVFIVPDQCHDAHGTGPCPLGDYSGSPDDLAALKESDNYLKAYVEAIKASKAWTEKSVIFVTYDENDYSSDLACCGVTGVGGSHVVMVAVVPNGQPLRDAEPHNHYSLLATIEDNFGLPRLAEAQNVDNLHGILPQGAITTASVAHGK